MTYQSNNRQPNRRNARNQSWAMWLLIATAVFVALFVCGVSSVILWRMADRYEAFGGASQTILEPPTRAPALVIPTPLPTAGGEAAVEVQSEPEVAPTAEVAATAEPVDSAENLVITPAPTATLRDPNLPTATPRPVQTATIPPNGSVTAFRSAEPFTIDGDLSDWAGYTPYNSTYRVYTSGSWDGIDDSEGFWRLAWDDNNLYIGVLVTDDVHVQTQTGNQTFRGDSLEMQIDTDRDGDYGSTLSPDDFQLVFSAGNFADIGPSAFRFRASGAGQMRDAVGATTQVAASQIDGGYTLEAAIPWADLWMQPRPGLVMGLSLNVNDNDAPGTAQQQMLKSHVSTRLYANPSTWGLLFLSER